MEYENLLNLLNKIGQEAVDYYKEDLKTNNSYATGNLFNSVQYKIEITSTNIILSFDNLPDYYYYVEYGRKPTKRIVSSSGDKRLQTIIRKWIDDKGIVPYEINGVTPTKDQLAYLITRKIHKEGFEGKLYIRDIRTKLYYNYENELREALIIDIKNMIK